MSVNSPPSEAFDAYLLGLFENADQGRLDLQGFKQIDLFFGLRVAVEDPSINAAISLFESLLDQRPYVLIRHYSALINALLDGLPRGGAPRHLML